MMFIFSLLISFIFLFSFDVIVIHHIINDELIFAFFDNCFIHHKGVIIINKIMVIFLMILIIFI